MFPFRRYLYRTTTHALAIAWAGLSLLLAVSVARAEHRVALLIDNSQNADEQLALPPQDLKGLADALRNFGFRVQQVSGLTEQQLKQSIEAFADSTPTCGTALIYFRGPVLGGAENGKPGICLLGTDTRAGRGRLLDSVIDGLNSQGGSQLNVVILDSPQAALKGLELPDGCAVCQASGVKLAAEAVRAKDFLIALRASSESWQANLADPTAISGSGSQAIGPPDAFVEGRKAGDEWVNSRGMVFCWCPAGSFTAGSPASEPQRYPDEQQRTVTIEHGFWISKYELTLRENLRGRPHDTIAQRKNDPLTMINHDDAKAMTGRTLSEAQRRQGALPSDWEYSLPTEEQWEYAARAGTTTRFYFGDDIADLPQHANFADKSFYDSKDIYSNAAVRTLSDGAVKLATVGSYQPNPWGLHDVYGNVAEWCINTAIRGGSWASVPENCRSAYRDQFSSRNEQNFIGYRIVIRKIPAKASGR